LETFHEAGKDPDVLEVLNICVITGKMDGRIFFYKSQLHFIQTKSIQTYPMNGNKNFTRIYIRESKRTRRRNKIASRLMLNCWTSALEEVKKEFKRSGQISTTLKEFWILSVLAI
jgi:hypothetical protein